MIVVSAILVLSCEKTDTVTYRQTDADERFTLATLVGVSNAINIIHDCVCVLLRFVFDSGQRSKSRFAADV